MDRDFLPIEIHPWSLGVETVGGFMTKTLLRNTVTPARTTRMFMTSRDNQSTTKIRVLMRGAVCKGVQGGGDFKSEGNKGCPERTASERDHI